MSSSKSIGNQFERRVAKILSDGFGGEWIRTPTSGAMLGGKNIIRAVKMDNSQTRLFTADLIPPLEWSNIYVECKKRAKINFAKFLYGEHKEFDSWVNQIITTIPKDSDVIPFIIFCEKFGKPIISIPIDTNTKNLRFLFTPFSMNFGQNVLIDNIKQSYVIYFYKNVEVCISFMLFELTIEAVNIIKKLILENRKNDIK
jgi:hypothetical protein